MEVLEETEAPIAADSEAGGVRNMSKCTRCGKERIIKSSRTEVLEKTSVIYTVTICPDPECQNLVEKSLIVEENKRKVMHDEQEKRAQELALKRKNLRR